MDNKQKTKNIGKSEAYFFSLRKTSKEAYSFYVNYGDGDPYRGYMDSLKEEERYKEDLCLLWYYIKETKVMSLWSMFAPAQEFFGSAGSVRTMIIRYLWSKNNIRVKPERKLLILKTLWDAHKQKIEEAKKYFAS